MTNKVTIEATIPTKDLEDFLTLVRSFDRARDNCHFRIAAFDIDGDMTVAMMVAMLERVGIPLRFAGRNDNG